MTFDLANFSSHCDWSPTWSVRPPKYKVIITDNPWSFDDKLTMSDVDRGAEANYATMSTEEIAALPVQEVVDREGAILAMWCPSTHLVEGLHIMQAWGFELKGTFIWVKITKDGWVPDAGDEDLLSYHGSLLGGGLSFYMGRYFRQCHELALIGTCGRVKVSSRSERSVCLAYNEGHSIKPYTLHERMERLVPGGPYLEMFGRRRHPNWTVLGNEIDGRDIRHSLPNLCF